ncbi:hypothetical protein K450DRAFT_263829 [Umbelopsis ramanniana AG]|uniref:Uncharacterized protein n=1 Tax=Umbelopsis ramanniana AG TaxID=1314678 RepID=A0AAD5E143_UMBRA|nr:uncharacterized protein K450DRAFT_263829 [Umbelopsis ramanniana AG]KAI8574999.1 hypothetical protein K450DRAFT_263829 [Umbelopsis ramanniana AG]
MNYASLQPTETSSINFRPCIELYYTCRKRYFTSTSGSQSPAGSGAMFQFSTPGTGSGLSSNFRLLSCSSPSSMFMGVAVSSLSAAIDVVFGGAGSGKDVGRTTGLL